jgi:two-component system phosphate regulon response regulator OmpR
VRSFARDVLEDHGYKVHEAADAVEALAATSHHRFDLLVTDVVMPGMSGVELVNSLEATSGEGMPVVLTSGFAEDPEIVGLMGSVPFLAKPFGASDLLRAVRGALDDVTGPRFAHGSNL